MKRIVFVRHGHTNMNSDPVPRIRGFLDVKLNDIGIAAVRKSAEYIRYMPFQIYAIYASPMVRCYETANIVKEVCGIDAYVVSDGDLTEVNWGEWEGKTYVEAMGRDDFQSILPHHMNPPGGENFFSVIDRCRHFVRGVLEGAAENVMAVSHGCVLALMLCEVFDIPINKYWTFYLSNAKVGVITWNGRMWALESWGLPASV